MTWSDLVIAVVGGDRREQEIARCAIATGATVRGLGFPWPDSGIAGVERTKSLSEALSGADIALFPIPGIAPDGALFAPTYEGRLIPDRAALAGMRAPANIILGWADAGLKTHCEVQGITIHEYEWDRDLMLLRGPAIVEGLLRVLIENTDITIHKAFVCQIGQGAIGSLATRTLLALGARVHVVARNSEQRAGAYAAGADVYEFGALPELLTKADMVITSVPVRVLDEELLRSIPFKAVLVDVAAPPGGIDHAAAAKLGLKSIWARGMGSRAPGTVGRSQWSGISKRINRILETRGS